MNVYHLLFGCFINACIAGALEINSMVLHEKFPVALRKSRGTKGVHERLGRKLLMSSLTQWSQLGGDIEGEAEEDRSGYSVSISADGNTVAVGASNNDGNGIWSGHARVYRWESSQWSQLGGDIDGEAAGDSSGRVSLSADGNTVAIGADYNEDNGYYSGHARIYRWDLTQWSQLGGDIDGEAAGDWSARSLSISADGNTVAIGASLNDGNGDDSGHARIYRWNSTQWSQLGGDIDGEAAGDWSGYSVSLSADGYTVAIGAPYNDANGSNSGHARIYGWNSTRWSQLGGNINGKAAAEWSGYSVSLSADGNTVAIGAPYNDANGVDSGHARIYGWNLTQWSQLGDDIDGEAADDLFGWRVSLSADGNSIAIGAVGNDGNGSNSGHVRIYR